MTRDMNQDSPLKPADFQNVAYNLAGGSVPLGDECLPCKECGKRIETAEVAYHDPNLVRLTCWCKRFDGDAKIDENWETDWLPLSKAVAAWNEHNR